MINPHPAPAVSAAPVVAPATNDAGIPQDAGVYILLKGVVTEMESEVVGWQTGGVMKSIATQGSDQGTHQRQDHETEERDSGAESF